MMNIVQLHDTVLKLHTRLANIEQYTNNIGDYKLSARTSDYAGWLLCDGRAISREHFSDLYEVIGTSFGSNNEYTFNLPDYRGRVMGICGQGFDLTSRSLGELVGEEFHALTVEELPEHNHTGTTGTAGLHTHTASTGTAGAHTHTTNAVGTTIGLVTKDGTGTAGSIDDVNGENELNIAKSPEPLTMDSNGNHTHTVSVDSAGGHSHALVTEYTGSNVSHNNMQPTLFGANVFIYTGTSTNSILS